MHYRHIIYAQSFTGRNNKLIIKYASCKAIFLLTFRVETNLTKGKIRINFVPEDIFPLLLWPRPRKHWPPGASSPHSAPEPPAPELRVHTSFGIQPSPSTISKVYISYLALPRMGEVEWPLTMAIKIMLRWVWWQQYFVYKRIIQLYI